MSVPRVVPTLLLTLFLLVILLAIVLMPKRAAADPRTDCPPPGGPCKIISLTAEEEQALLGPKMVLETAVQARQIDLFGIANYFREKIARAPAGDLPKAPEKPADPQPQSSGAK